MSWHVSAKVAVRSLLFLSLATVLVVPLAFALIAWRFVVLVVLHVASARELGDESHA